MLPRAPKSPADAFLIIVLLTDARGTYLLHRVDFYIFIYIRLYALPADAGDVDRALICPIETWPFVLKWGYN
ncbi:hypothetical protein T492DRAFT_1029166 [Pavlovales sp. CCMP2436]|nr:hypothetical protein T492DRAFT_1029166 [Pavlovales sp. CCMP2436]